MSTPACRTVRAVNAIIPPLAIHGSVLTIRILGRPVHGEGPHQFRYVHASDLVTVMEACVRARLNILVSGGTGTGKTTEPQRPVVVQSRMGERIITIEDSAELQLQQPHVINLESRPANAEAKARSRSATS